MDTNTRNNLKANSIGTLPEDIQYIFNENMVSNSVAAIQEIYELSHEQAIGLENEITLTLLGLEFISTFESRSKTALQMTDEKVFEVLEDVAGMLFTAEIMALLNEMEQVAKPASTSIQQMLEIKNQSHLNPPNLPTAPQKAPEPGIVANPPEPVVESDKKNGLHMQPSPEKKSIPTGKMVGLAKEETESTIKGMRTMRGDINRLRTPEENNGSNFTKPFKGSLR